MVMSGRPSHLLAANAVKEMPLFRPASFLIFLASPENICIPLVYGITAAAS